MTATLVAFLSSPIRNWLTTQKKICVVACYRDAIEQVSIKFDVPFRRRSYNYNWKHNFFACCASMLPCQEAISTHVASASTCARARERDDEGHPATHLASCLRSLQRSYASSCSSCSCSICRSTITSNWIARRLDYGTMGLLRPTIP